MVKGETNVNKKSPTHIRVSNLERTLRMIESMIEEMANDDARQGALLVIRLIRKQYGLDNGPNKEKARE